MMSWRSGGWRGKVIVARQTGPAAAQAGTHSLHSGLAPSLHAVRARPFNTRPENPARRCVCGRQNGLGQRPHSTPAPTGRGTTRAPPRQKAFVPRTSRCFGRRRPKPASRKFSPRCKLGLDQKQSNLIMSASRHHVGRGFGGTGVCVAGAWSGQHDLHPPPLFAPRVP